MTTTLRDSQLNEFKHALKGRFQALREEIRQELLASDEEQYGELAGQVHDMEDESVADLLVDLNLANIDRHLRELRDVDAALMRLGNDEYGLCIDCGCEIEYPRLQANPSAARCLECQTQYEHLHLAQR